MCQVKAGNLGTCAQIVRNTAALSKNSEFKVDDLTSTELQIIDSIPKLFELQRELLLCNLKGSSDVEHNGLGYRFWKFLSDWNSFTQDEKILKYDEFACHEVN